MTKQIFQKASLELWNQHKQSLRAVQLSYLQGKEDAFAEVMKYLCAKHIESDFRYIQIKDFISFIESRYQSHREECEKQNKKSESQTDF